MYRGLFTVAAIFAAVYLLVLSFAAFADTPPALVQPSVSGGWDFSPLLTNLQQFASGVLMLAVTGLLAAILKPVNEWFGTNISAREIAKDLKMGEYANVAVAKALDYAKQQTGLTDAALKDVQLRNPMLSLAAAFLFKQYPEVWTWVAKSEAGVMQYIEAHLPASAALPPNNVDGVGPVNLTKTA